MTYTLSGCRVITGDEQCPYYPAANIVIKDGIIKKIGPAEICPAEGEQISLRGKLVAPGLINCHHHLPSVLYRDLGSDLPLMDWLQQAMWPAQAHMTGEDAYCAALLSCAEQIQNGITTTVDQYYYADCNARAVKRSGMRAVIGATVFDHPSPESKDTLQTAVDFIEKYRHDERITPCFGPHAPYTESPRTYRRIAALAAEMGVMVHTHIGETRGEVDCIREKYGTTSTQLLEETGLFENRVIAAHNIYLSPQDIDIFAKYQVGAVFCPVSNLKLASGIPDIAPFIKAGIPTAFGTDGAESNNALDLLQDAKIGLLLQKTMHRDAALMPAEQGLAMLTAEAADIIGMAHCLGRLMPGYQADLVVFDDAFANAVPHHATAAQETAHLLYSLSGKNVQSTMVAGKWLMYERQIRTFDYPAVARQVQQRAARIAADAGLL